MVNGKRDAGDERGKCDGYEKEGEVGGRKKGRSLHFSLFFST